MVIEIRAMRNNFMRKAFQGLIFYSVVSQIVDSTKKRRSRIHKISKNIDFLKINIKIVKNSDLPCTCVYVKKKKVQVQQALLKIL